MLRKAVTLRPRRDLPQTTGIHYSTVMARLVRATGDGTLLPVARTSAGHDGKNGRGHDDVLKDRALPRAALATPQRMGEHHQ